MAVHPLKGLLNQNFFTPPRAARHQAAYRALGKIGQGLLAAGAPSRIPQGFGSIMGAIGGFPEAYEKGLDRFGKKRLTALQMENARQTFLRGQNQIRERKENGFIITEGWKDGEWREISKARRWEPKQLKAPARTNIYKNAVSMGLVPGSPDWNKYIRSVTEKQPPKAPDRTTAHKLATNLGYKPGTTDYNNFILKYAFKKKDPTVTVNIPDATNTKIANDAFKAQEAQMALMTDADIMIAMLDSGLETDALKPIGTRIAAALHSLGIEVDKKLPMAEAFRALTNISALRLRNPASGLGLTGNTSDRDLKFLRESTAGLGKTTEANLIVLITMRAKARRMAALASLKADHILKNNSLKGITAKRNKFIKETRLFTEEEEARIKKLSVFGLGREATGSKLEIEKYKNMTAEQVRGLSDQEFLRAYKIIRGE